VRISNRNSSASFVVVVVFTRHDYASISSGERVLR
jgi:hypothetical protein